MLRLDLQAAGIPYRDDEGRVCDFHSLRHSYITLLERSGAHPKVAQELARHSDIRLTMQVYTHTRLHDLAGAVEDLPALLDTAPAEAERVRATGTDGSGLSPVCTEFVQTNDTGRLAVIPVDIAMADGAGNRTGHNPLILQEIEAGQDSLRLVDTELPGQDSNLDKENQNLLCYRYTTG